MANKSIQSLTSQIRLLNEEIDGALSNIGKVESRLGDTQKSIEAVTKSTRGSLDSALSNIQGRTSEMKRQVREEINNLRSSIESLVEEAANGPLSDFDAFIERLKNSDSEIAAALAKAAEQVKQGDITLQEFLKKFGEIKLEIGIGAETIQQHIQSLNLAQLQSDIQNSKDQLEGDIGSWADLMGRLKSIHSEAARVLAQVIELWQKGKLELRDVVAALERLKEATPEGTTTSNLLDEVEQFLNESSSLDGYTGG